MSEVSGPAATGAADAPPVPQGRYVAAVVEGDMVFSAGMTPRRDGRLAVTGRVGDPAGGPIGDPAGGALGVGEAAAAAGLAVANALAACRCAADAAGRVIGRPVRMTVWVACTADFADQSAVADGASAVLADRFGADLLPVRATVGVLALPGGAPVEVELTAALAPVGDR